VEASVLNYWNVKQVISFRTQVSASGVHKMKNDLSA
jgi:hypothetical protein